MNAATSVTATFGVQEALPLSVGNNSSNAVESVTIGPPNNQTNLGTLMPGNTASYTGYYGEGTVVPITATLVRGTDVLIWGGACTGNTSRTCNVTMDATKSVTLTFNN